MRLKNYHKEKKMKTKMLFLKKNLAKFSHNSEILLLQKMNLLNMFKKEKKPILLLIKPLICFMLLFKQRN